MVCETRSTSRSVGPRPLATQADPLGAAPGPAAAAWEASSGLSQVYFRMSALEPSRWEQ